MHCNVHCRVNLTALKQFGSVQRGDIIDRFTFDFEGELIQEMTDRGPLQQGIQMFVNIHRMFFETMEGQVCTALCSTLVTVLRWLQVFKDIGMLLLGYLIVFCYVLIMLGRLHCVEQKVRIILHSALRCVGGRCI